MLLKISMETITFAIVLRSSEVSLHILVQKGSCMSFPCFTVGLSRFTVWMKVKRHSYVIWTVQVERFSPFCLFCLEYAYFHILFSFSHRNMSFLMRHINRILVQRYEIKMKQPNLRGRKGSILGGVFRHFVQKNHHFENQPIKQNDGLTIWFTLDLK